MWPKARIYTTSLIKMLVPCGEFYLEFMNIRRQQFRDIWKRVREFVNVNSAAECTWLFKQGKKIICSVSGEGGPVTEGLRVGW